MSKRLFFSIFLLGSLLACSGGNSLHTKEKKEIPIDSSTVEKQDSIPSEKLLSYNLVDVQELNSSIRIDLKYASEDNFTRTKLYSKISRALLQKDVAERLAKCQLYLSQLHKNYSLLIYDALRPVSVQWKMWKALDTIPVAERVKFVSNPANGSIHNYGAAVDLTICDENGIPLDMGAGYDDIRKIAYPRFESEFLASGELTVEQVENRKLLRKIMASQGFINIPTEWWHFNACSRAEAKAKYKVMLEE